MSYQRKHNVSSGTGYQLGTLKGTEWMTRKGERWNQSVPNISQRVCCVWSLKARSQSRLQPAHYYMNDEASTSSSTSLCDLLPNQRSFGLRSPPWLTLSEHFYHKPKHSYWLCLKTLTNLLFCMLKEWVRGLLCYCGVKKRYRQHYVLVTGLASSSSFHSCHVCITVMLLL